MQTNVLAETEAFIAKQRESLLTQRRELLAQQQTIQAQIDELWTFVKKNKRSANPMIPRMSAICGYGVPWRCPAACAS